MRLKTAEPVSTWANYVENFPERPQKQESACQTKLNFKIFLKKSPQKTKMVLGRPPGLSQKLLKYKVNKMEFK